MKRHRNTSRSTYRVLKREVDRQCQKVMKHTAPVLKSSINNASGCDIVKSTNTLAFSSSSTSNNAVIDNLENGASMFCNFENFEKPEAIGITSTAAYFFETASDSSSTLSNISTCESNCSCINCAPDVVLEVCKTTGVHCDQMGWKEKIQHWAVSHQVTHASLKDLLKILRPAFPELPNDPKTLLKIGKRIDIEKMGEGYYYNFKLKEVLHNRLTSLDKVHNKIFLNFNIDSLPLFKSTNTSFIPILGLITEVKFPPFVCAVYYGPGKPPIEMLMKDFAPDLEELLDNGIEFNGNIIQVQVNAFVCDAPARAYVKSISGHRGYWSCERCTQKGSDYEKRMLFLEMDAPLRSDESFMCYSQTEHHNGISPLTDIGILMVSQFVLDYMHLVCLGIMRKLLFFWIEHKRRLKFSSKFIRIIERLMEDASKMWPSDFNRKPRSFDELKRWKATELRQFLLYLGPVFLRDYLPKIFYEHFLLLHTAITIFVRQDLCNRMHCKAVELLRIFVNRGKLPELYGKCFLIYNVHCLLHIGDDVKKFGALDNISAFVFENELHNIKCMIRGGTRPLQQLVNRIKEKEIIRLYEPKFEEGLIHTSQWKGGSTAGLLGGRHYSKYILNKKIVSLKYGDNFVMLKNSSVVSIINFYENSEGVWVVAKIFVQYSNLYSFAIKSSKLGICVAEKLNEFPHRFHINELETKCLAIPMEQEGKFAVFPLVN